MQNRFPPPLFRVRQNLTRSPSAVSLSLLTCDDQTPSRSDTVLLCTDGTAVGDAVLAG